ncbi:MAG TPA: cysteine-rich small domain-containing protein [Candidatus Hydrothermia bacterium]|nr:hypothetical protein [Candidatus Hydrothermae bacterium]MDD3649083.1 cysteine-rich small domain-containing protein [Candidatus Hydrothermia bacterium]MDD5572866.1 cysteine-rich small domain-containing protein [Candidatus Hydrothermia bacterium]HOL23718.1 cysteine-rich small domain-containing protein [Candidatus Hydrothermia bacterium]HOP32134.1 cysteine-rich small domain-containing protein [Candidatus Hydrothermia bacterium]
MEYIEDKKNPLEKWFEEFEKKRDSIVKRMGLKDPKEIADYFSYSNMKEQEKDFCPLYKKSEKCHNIDENELCCFFCGCPFYDFAKWDEKKKHYGACKIFSKHGFRNNYGYWDCSNCETPHTKKFTITYLKKLNKKKNNRSTPLTGKVS